MVYDNLECSITLKEIQLNFQHLCPAFLLGGYTAPRHRNHRTHKKRLLVLLASLLASRSGRFPFIIPGPGHLDQNLLLQRLRHGKSRKHASNACGQFFLKIVDIFGQTTIFLQFIPINAHKSVSLATINPFLLENIVSFGKIAFLDTFRCIGTI